MRAKLFVTISKISIKIIFTHTQKSFTHFRLFQNFMTAKSYIIVSLTLANVTFNFVLFCYILRSPGDEFVIVEFDDGEFRESLI